MKKITNILLTLIISVTSISVCYADWQGDLQKALQKGETALDLSHQNIDDEGAKLIAQALAAPNCKLIELNLEDNNISDKGAKFITEALTSSECKLTKFELDLNGNKITPNGTQLVKQTFAWLNSKQVIPRFPGMPKSENNNLNDVQRPQDFIDALAKHYEPRLKVEIRQEFQNLGQTKSMFERQVVNGVLNLTDRQLSPEDIKEICALKSIEELTLVNCGLRYIPRFPENYPAVSINLSRNKFKLSTNNEQDMLQKLLLLPNLKSLNLSNCGITTIKWFDSSKCQLIVLSIAQNNLEPLTMELVTGMPELEAVELGSCSLKRMPKFISQKLAMLDLSKNDFSKSGGDLKQLFEHTTLNTLLLDDCKVVCVNFNPEQCKLKMLSLRGNKPNEELMSKLGSVTTIKELLLQDCDLKYKEVQALVLALYMQQLQQPIELWKLNLSLNNLEGANLQQLFQIKSLRILSVGNCNIKSLLKLDLKSSKLENLGMGKNPDLDNQSIMEIIKIPSLKQLEIHGCKPDQETVKAIMKMPEVEIVNMNGCNITSLGDFDPKNSKIYQLWVAGSPLKEDSFSKISQLPRLIKLNIRQCNAKQESLAHVFGIDKLEYLEIGEQELQDNWILKKGGRGIKELNLGIDRQNIPEFIAEYSWLPSLEILNKQPLNRVIMTNPTYTHQKQIRDDFNQLKQEQDNQEAQNSQELERIKIAAAKIQDMTKNTLHIFESGGQ